MFAIAGVTGNTGSVVADALLAAKQPVRVIVRDEAKGAPWRAKGAEVRVANLHDAKALTEALRGATGAYLLQPNDYASKDFFGTRARLVDAALEAIPASGVRHVVFLSSIGAQHARGTGAILSVHDAETRLGELDVPITFVRAAYFLDNWVLHSLPPVLSDGVVPMFFRESLKLPMVAVADIGRTVAKVLLEGPSAAGVIELAGPAEYSGEDVAATFAKLLGRPVKTVLIPPEKRVDAIVAESGMVKDIAPLYAEMDVGLESGLVAFQGSPARLVRGTTTLEEVLAGGVKR